MTDPASQAEVPEDALASSGLQFLDLLYALVAGDVAMRVSGADWRQISLAGWGGVCVSVTAIVLSWIGYHRDRIKVKVAAAQRGRVGKFGFFEQRFVQFLVELLILGAYFAMGLQLKFPSVEHRVFPGEALLRLRVSSDHGATPSAQWEVAWIVAIFVLYLVWDVLDVRLAVGVEEWTKVATTYRKITLYFVALFTMLLVIVTILTPSSSKSVFVWDLVLVALLYLYRVLQDPAEDDNTRIRRFRDRIPPRPKPIAPS